MSTPGPKRKKVFIDALPLALPHLSGIGHVVWHIVDGLDKDADFLADHEIILIASRKGIPQLKKLGFKNVRYEPWPIKPRIINALNYYDILPPIDLFMGKGLYIFGNFTTWPLARSESITYIHDIGYERFPEFAKPAVYRMLHKNVPKWIKRTTAVVAVSQAAKGEIHTFYQTPLEKITVIHNGFDPQEFYPRPQNEIQAVRKKYDLRKPYIFFLSNLEPRKNLERLIQAFAALPKKQRDALTLFIVGSEGWQDERIRAALAAAIEDGCDIRRPDHFVPNDDLPALHSGAELLAHPAAYEGFGISVLQAMACGTPVLVSKTSSLPEVAGDAGLYIDYTSIPDIADKMSHLLSDQKLRETLREKGLKQAKKFLWQASEDILKELIERLESTRR